MTPCRSRPYATACRTASLLNGARAWLIVTYATLNGGRLSSFSLELPWIVGTSGGWVRSAPLISPVWSAWTRAVLFEIGRMITRSIFGFLPQYFVFLTSSTFSPTVQDLNTNGPVPVGWLNAYVPVG